MNFNTIKQVLLICLMLQIGSAFFCSTAQAQEAQPVTTSELGVGIGGANYKGEISPAYRFLNNQPAINIFYRRDISAPLTFKAGLMGSHRIFEHKAFRDQDQELPYHDWRNMDLKLSLLEFSLNMEYNFLDYYADIRQPHRISPYFFAGVALLNYNHQLSQDGDVLKPFDNKFTVAVPFGVGVKYALSRHWNLGLEFGARKMFNDIIDFLNEDDSRELANPFSKDMYFYNGISLSYTFYRINCPPVYKRKAGVLD